jgi:rod shape-determining protein MreD
MQRYLLPVILYIVFLFEGTMLPMMIPASWQTRIAIAPHFAFIIILFIAIYVSRHWALAYGLGFGMLQDIVYYGPMVGTYTFGMGLISYLIGIMALRSKATMMTSIMFILIGNLLLDLLIFGIYRIFQITHLTVDYALTHYVLPSLLINLLFALVVYVPIRKLLDHIQSKRVRDEEEHFH